jgi:glutamate synthase domain-containing protein 1
LCKFTREISNVENLHDLNVFFYTSSKKSTFKAGNKAQIHTIFFNRVIKVQKETIKPIEIAAKFRNSYIFVCKMVKAFRIYKIVGFPKILEYSRWCPNTRDVDQKLETLSFSFSDVQVG